MKHSISALLVACVSLSASPGIASKLEEQAYLSESPELTPEERSVIEMARKWEKSNAATPTAGENGEILFVYGTQRPRIICAPLSVCDVALQRGEKLTSWHIGDSKRWNVVPATTGGGADEMLHMIIKPTDAGLETNLMVGTDRRMYNVLLRSHATESMPRVAFTYPEEALAQWEIVRKKHEKEMEEKTIPESGSQLDDLSFDYAVVGESRWKPVRVYNDGKRTIIQMPASISQTKLPALYILQKEAGIFSDEKLEIVNSRFRSGSFVVDNVFDKAILVMGTGDDRERVTISRGGVQ